MSDVCGVCDDNCGDTCDQPLTEQTIFPLNDIDPDDEVANDIDPLSQTGHDDMNRTTIYTHIDRERERQNTNFPHQTPQHLTDTPHLCMSVLTEEVGEVARAILNNDRVNLHDELVQVAAVAVAWLEGLEATRTTMSEGTSPQETAPQTHPTLTTGGLVDTVAEYDQLPAGTILKVVKTPNPYHLGDVLVSEGKGLFRWFDEHADSARLVVRHNMTCRIVELGDLA